MKILHIIILLGISITVNSQRVMIDTIIWEQTDSTNQPIDNSEMIIKTYDYKLYQIDSTWINSKFIDCMTNQKSPKELSDLYLDSLSSTTSYIERKKLPINRLPDEFYIFYSNIITGDWCRDEYRVLIYFNKKKKKEVIIYTDYINGKTASSKPQVFYRNYCTDSIKPLIKKLNKLIIWDPKEKYSIPYGKTYTMASNHGLVNLVFKYNDVYFRNTFDVSNVAEYGMSYELQSILRFIIDNDFESNIELVIFSKNGELIIDENKDEKFDKASTIKILSDIKESDLIEKDEILLDFLNSIE